MHSSSCESSDRFSIVSSFSLCGLYSCYEITLGEEIIMAHSLSELVYVAISTDFNLYSVCTDRDGGMPFKSFLVIYFGEGKKTCTERSSLVDISCVLRFLDI